EAAGGRGVPLSSGADDHDVVELDAAGDGVRPVAGAEGLRDADSRVARDGVDLDLVRSAGEVHHDVGGDAVGAEARDRAGRGDVPRDRVRADAAGVAARGQLAADRV